MKRILLLMTLLCAFSSTLFAQQFQEVVYLKNGSVIRGMIIEQVPNESLKIQTADGNIFAYKMSEVERITKEQPFDNKEFNDKGDRDYKIKKGYRGFVDFGYTFGLEGEDKYHDPDNRIDFLTSHGYQFNSCLFIGVGAGYSYWHKSGHSTLPIFLNLRADAPTGSSISPFFDIKFGYSVVDHTGVYGKASIGGRIATRNNHAINFSAGYLYFRNLDNKKYDTHGLALTVGYEF